MHLYLYTCTSTNKYSLLVINMTSGSNTDWLPACPVPFQKALVDFMVLTFRSDNKHRLTSGASKIFSFSSGEFIRKNCILKDVEREGEYPPKNRLWRIPISSNFGRDTYETSEYNFCAPGSSF